jgi:Family of unknown function (DUF6350)
VTTQLDRVRPVSVASPARSPVASGAVAGVWAAALGLACVALVVLVGWLLGPHGTLSPVDATRAGVLVWLAAHHVGVSVSEGELSLVPLGLLALPAWMVYRSARWAGRVSVDGLPAMLAATTALAVVYATAAGVLASLTQQGRSGVGIGGAIVGAGALALLAGGPGVLSGGSMWGELADRLPEPAVPVARGAAAGVAVLVGGGALLATISLAFHAGQVSRLTAALAASPWGTATLLLVALLAVPSAAVWGAAYAVGPGFAVGVGTAVAPSGVALGPVPAFPLLGALPSAGPAPGASLVALAVAPLAGIVVGLLAARRPAATQGRTAAEAAASGALAGVALGLLAWLSAGSLGAERMAQLGPDAVRVGTAAALEVALVAAAVGWEAARHERLVRSAAQRLRALPSALRALPPALGALRPGRRRHPR